LGVLDPSRLARIVAAIPPGRWMSYGDVARACGGAAEHARVLHQLFVRHGIAGAHRVLKADGTIGRADGIDVRRQLEAEGVHFVAGRASEGARFRLPGAGPTHPKGWHA
jgi:alkylated DNA nucleotide flippase Atl1